MVEGGKSEPLLVTVVHDDEWRPHAPGGVVAEQVAAAERITPQDFIVVGIERLSATSGQLSTRHASHDRGDCLDRLIHLGRDVTERGIAVAAEPDTDASHRALLSTRPEEPRRREGERVSGSFRSHRTRIKGVRVLASEHQEAEPQPGEFYRRFWKIEAELLEGAAARRDEHVTGRGERQNCRARVEYGGSGKQRARPSGTHRLEPVTP